MDRVLLFKNLMVMAAIDGKLTKEEVTYLSLRSVRWDIPNEQFQAALDYALGPNAQLSLPTERKECREMLSDLIRTMAVDGELAVAEKELCALAAVHMNISGEELNGLLDSMLPGDD